MKLIHRVVIMEDDVELRSAFKDELAKSNLYVRIARSTNQLSKLVEEDPYDAGILDIRMSEDGNEGLSSIKHLNEQHPEMYIEVQTGYREYVKPAFEMGADEVLVKPEGYGPEAAQRIKKGILKKKLSILAETAGIELPEINGQFSNGDDQELAWAAISADILTDCLIRVNSFLVSNSDEYGIDEDTTHNLKRGIAHVIFDLVFNGNGTAQRKDKNEIVDPELANDPNYKAFIQEREKLEKEHMNQYVAFVDGKFVDVDREVGALLKRLDEAHGERTAFVKKITAKKRVVAFRRPKRVKRT